MRIASTQYHSTMNTALQTANARSESLLERLASGQRLSVASDDPVAAVRLSRLTREEASLDQYRNNIGALKSRLQQNEALLSGMNDTMLQSRDLMVWAADGGNAPEDVSAMADSLKALRDSLYDTSNSRDTEGRYLFAGTTSGNPAVTLDSAAAPGARYAYAGNTGEQKVVIGNGITQVANVSLPDIADLLNQFDSTIASLQAPGADVNQPATRAVVVATLQSLDGHLDSVTTRIAGLGGAQNMLQTLDNNHANVSLSNKQAAITLGQLDYSEASVELQSYTTALQATQKAYAKVSGLSLFDVL